MGIVRLTIEQQRDSVCELLKLLRSEQLTVQDIAQHLECSMDTARRWLDTFVQHGIVELVVEDVRRRPQGGTVPHGYRLSRQWGGQAR